MIIEAPEMKVPAEGESGSSPYVKLPFRVTLVNLRRSFRATAASSIMFS
jgi:hypothetical protein